jgi:zinc protease
MQEIKRYREEGITGEELAFVKAAMGQSDARKYETSFQKAAFLNNILRYNLEADYVKKQNEILQHITKEEINALAKKYLPYEKMNILLVGDKAAIKPGLEKLGYEVVELDAEGNVKKQIADIPVEAKEAPLPMQDAKGKKKKARNAEKTGPGILRSF